MDLSTLLNKLITGHYAMFFKEDLTSIDKEYKRLCKLVHPDVCSDPLAEEAFYMLQVHHDAAIDAIKDGIWQNNPNEVRIAKSDGVHAIVLNPLYRHETPICNCYVCSTHVVYTFDFSKEKYYNNYIKKVKGLDLKPLGKLKISPKIVDNFKGKNEYVIVLDKTADVYPLRAVIENFWNNEIPDRHLAWMISRLMNLCAFLQFNGLSLNGLDIDNLFVSLKYHSLLLFGGWWFAVPEDTPMIGTTKDILDLMPPKVKANKTGSILTDLECIKQLGRSYGGNSPDPMKQFFNTGCKKEVLDEWAKWDEALDKSYGERRFIKIDVTDDDIYKRR